jgi:carbohydrate binding protein with CBM4/9 domain/cortical protein marker for cell polarity
MPYPRALPAQHSHRVFPAPVIGYRISGKWEVVEPIGASVVNLIKNPSLELNSTGYNAQGSAAIARDSTVQRRGVYSLKVTPTSAQLDGAYYDDTLTLVGQTTYTLAFDFKGAGGYKYRFYVSNNLNNAISPITSFVATGGFQRVSVTFRDPHTAGASIVRRVYLIKDFSTNTIPFYWDGLCLTATPYPTTYFDGDNVGFIIGRSDFFWNGTRHGSASTMASYTRAGGKITPLAQYGLTLLAMLGLGMQPLSNISTPLASIGGSQYQRTVAMDRVFDLVGAITGNDLPILQDNRRKLINLFKQDATPTDSPMLLLYTPVDECGNEVGETLEIPCVYENGLEGTINNHYQEGVDLRFHSFLPFLANASGEHGQALTYQQVLPSGFVFTRDALGTWTRMGDGLNNQITVVLPLPNGLWLVGGLFTDAGGDANADYLAYYDPNTNTFSAINATPLVGSFVNALALLPDGNRVLVGGSFTDAGGNPTADYLCILNLTTGVYSAVNLTPLNALVRAIVTLNNGDFIIGGDFTDAVSADGDRLIKLSGSTFAFSVLNVTPIANNSVRRLDKLPNGDVIFTGSFTSATGVANINRTGYLTISTGAYSALSTTPLTTDTSGLAVGLDGKVYLGDSADMYSWSGPGAFFNALGGNFATLVFKLLTLPDGTILAGGSMTQAGGVALPSHMAIWSGSSFFPLDIGSGTTDAFPRAFTNDGKLIISASSVITGPAAYVNTIVNAGPCDAHPTFELLGPGSVYQIKNYSTGEALYFNLTLNAGERAILNLTPGRISFGSNFRPNLLGTILPGSALATFRLVPGSNAVSVFIAGTTNPSTSITVKWRDAHLAIDSAISAP